MRLDARALLRVGIVLCVAGFLSIAYTWARVAAVLAVPLQLPYVISGGLGGVVLVHLGVSSLRRGVELREAVETAARLDELTAALHAIATDDDAGEGATWTV